MPRKISPSTILRASRWALTAAAPLALGGCILPGIGPQADMPVDPNSPVARDVAYASRHPGPYPTFASIPKVPTDVRPPEAWRRDVSQVERRKAALDAQAASLPPVQTDTEAYAAKVRSRAAVPQSDVPPPDSAQETEAYAASLRERATPPPPPK